MRIVGMMSGTSLDGVDAVLAEYHNNIEGIRWKILGSAEAAIPSALKETLYQLNFPNRVKNELHAAKVAEHQLTQCYASAYQALLQNTNMNTDSVDAIAAHGQTIRHAPNDEFPYTLQLLNGALLSQITQTTVLCDFRSKDIAAGGQGAPLAPLFHRDLFPMETTYAVVNIGGISNISFFTKNTVTGFDCGPGNCLMDEWVLNHQQQPFDKNAQWAKQGKILPELLKKLLLDDYFSQPAPKSTGRHYFHQAWLKKYLSGNEAPINIMRTLVRLTATTIADAIPNDCEKVIVVGGGAKNPLLLSDLQTLLSNQQVVQSDIFDIDPQLVEPLGFAILGRMTLLQRKLDTTAITGAKQPVSLGAIYY